MESTQRVWADHLSSYQSRSEAKQLHTLLWTQEKHTHKQCYALVAHASVEFRVMDTGVMVTPSEMYTQMHIFPFISSCPWWPKYISSLTHFVLVGGLYGASCLMWPFCPFVLGVSGVWSLWIIPSVCFCSGKKVRHRKGTKRIKGDESTDISWRLLLLSKWSIVLFVLTHLITPPLLPLSLQPHISAPPHTLMPLFCVCMLLNLSVVLILFSHLITISQFASFPLIMKGIQTGWK